MNGFQIFAIVFTGTLAAYNAAKWADKEMTVKDRQKHRWHFFWNAGLFAFNVLIVLSTLK